MIKFSPGAIPKEVGDQICALNESRYHSRPRSPAWRGGGGGLYGTINALHLRSRPVVKKFVPVGWRGTVTRWPYGTNTALPPVEKNEIYELL